MILKDTLEIAYEISKLVKFSPKQEAKLEPVKEEICDTSSGFSKFSKFFFCVVHFRYILVFGAFLSFVLFFHPVEPYLRRCYPYEVFLWAQLF